MEDSLSCVGHPVQKSVMRAKTGGWVWRHRVRTNNQRNMPSRNALIKLFGIRRWPKSWWMLSREIIVRCIIWQGTGKEPDSCRALPCSALNGWMVTLSVRRKLNKRIQDLVEH